MQFVTKQHLRRSADTVYARAPGFRVSVAVFITNRLREWPEEFNLKEVTSRLEGFGKQSVAVQRSDYGDLLRQLAVAEEIDRFIPVLDAAFDGQGRDPGALPFLVELASNLRTKTLELIKKAEPTGMPLSLLPVFARATGSGDAEARARAQYVGDLCHRLDETLSLSSNGPLFDLDLAYLQQIAATTERESPTDVAAITRAVAIRRTLEALPASMTGAIASRPRPDGFVPIGAVLAEVFDDPATGLWRSYPEVRMFLGSHGIDLVRDSLPLEQFGQLVDNSKIAGSRRERLQSFRQAWASGQIGRGRRYARVGPSSAGSDRVEVRLDVLLGSDRYESLLSGQRESLQAALDAIQPQVGIDHFVLMGEVEGALTSLLLQPRIDRQVALTGVAALVSLSDSELKGQETTSLFQIAKGAMPGRNDFVRAYLNEGKLYTPVRQVFQRALGMLPSVDGARLTAAQMDDLARLIIVRGDGMERPNPDFYVATYLVDVMDQVSASGSRPSWSLASWCNRIHAPTNGRAPTSLSLAQVKAKILVSAAQRSVSIAEAEDCESALDSLNVSADTELDKAMIRSSAARSIANLDPSKHKSARKTLMRIRKGLSTALSGTPLEAALAVDRHEPELLDFALYAGIDAEEKGISEGGPESRAHTRLLRAFVSLGEDWGSKPLDSAVLGAEPGMSAIFEDNRHFKHMASVAERFGMESLWADVRTIWSSIHGPSVGGPTGAG